MRRERRGGKDGSETDWSSWAAETAAVEGGQASRGAVEVGSSILGVFQAVFPFPFGKLAEAPFFLWSHFHF